jgi:hypothetical protein
MQEEDSYICDNCGEEIVVPVDPSAGSSQEYVEIDADGEVRVSGEAE